MNALLPWHEPVLMALSAASPLPQAMLLHGPAGCGKTGLALTLATSMLCTDSAAAGRPCGRCDACRLVAAGTHPDLHVLTTEAFAAGHAGIAVQAVRYDPDAGDARARRRHPRHLISIEQVRAMIEAVQGHSHLGALRVVVVVPASAMNAHAANALLKILEEPPGATRFLLVASALDRISATVRSRCVLVHCAPPDDRQARRWLAGRVTGSAEAAAVLRLAPGAPLTALAWAEEGGIDQFDRYRGGLDALLAGNAAGVTPQTWNDVPVERLACWLQHDIAAAARDAVLAVEVSSGGGDDWCRTALARAGADALWSLVIRIGAFRLLPPLAVDERLFVDDIVDQLIEALHGAVPEQGLHPL